MKRNIGMVLLILSMTGFLGVVGYNSHEELAKQIAETEHKLELAEQRAIKAENIVKDLEHRKKVAKEFASVCGVKQ